MKNSFIVLIALFSILFTSCQKDSDFQTANTADADNIFERDENLDIAKYIPENIMNKLRNDEALNLEDKEQIDTHFFDAIVFEGKEYSITEAYADQRVRTAYFHTEYFTYIEDQVIYMYKTLEELETVHQSEIEHRSSCYHSRIRFWDYTNYNGAMLQTNRYQFCNKNYFCEGDILPSNWWYRASSMKVDGELSNSYSPGNHISCIDDEGYANIARVRGGNRDFPELLLSHLFGHYNWNNKMIAWSLGGCYRIDPANEIISNERDIWIVSGNQKDWAWDQHLGNNNLYSHPRHEGANQKWYIFGVADNTNGMYFRIHNKQTGKVLDQSLVDDNIYLFDQHDGHNQQWRIIAYERWFGHGDTEFTFVNRQTGKTLTRMGDNNLKAWHSLGENHDA